MVAVFCFGVSKKVVPVWKILQSVGIESIKPDNVILHCLRQPGIPYYTESTIFRRCCYVPGKCKNT